MDTVLVIGGGASGIMAGLTAAKDKSKHVILVERQSRIGRKLLATGNGRCNLTNTGACAENYHGDSPEFALPALEAFPPKASLDFFHSLGLLTVEEYGGRVYPLSNSANSVLDVLRLALERSGVEVRCACPVRELRRSGEGYLAICDDCQIQAQQLIVACGGPAGAKLGGVMDGYELLKPLGHKRTKLFPALVQLLTSPEYPRALKGVRADCALSLRHAEQELAHSCGELQFTDKGISGPAAFDLSRSAACAGESVQIHINFLRQYTPEQIKSLLTRRCAAYPGLETAQLFTGMLHNRLGRMLVKYAGLQAASTLSQLDDTALQQALEACTDFTLQLLGTEDFAAAQVTAGGIKTSGFNPNTLESWFMPGLFVCGELLDIDGDCGGYNLQWAWASGHLAGRLGK